MSNPWDSIKVALDEARAVDRALDTHANSMAQLLQGHLHKVNPCWLKALKRELRNFNIHTEKWKS